MAEKNEAPSRKAPAKAAEQPAAVSAEDQAASAPTSVEQLSAGEEIAARTGPDADPGNRFTKVFVISGRDFHIDGPLDDMHRANQVATLQEAINRGLHPQGGARFDGDEKTADGSVRLSYSVEVVLANEDEDPSSAYTPTFAVEDFGGTTMKDADKAND